MRFLGRPGLAGLIGLVWIPERAPFNIFNELYSVSRSFYKLPPQSNTDLRQAYVTVAPEASEIASHIYVIQKVHQLSSFA